MRILEADLAAYITALLLDIKRGCFDANKGGQLTIRLPQTVNFTCEVVRGSYNSITRDEVQAPATTQTDTSSQGGSDTSTVITTYTQYSYTTSP